MGALKLHITAPRLKPFQVLPLAGLCRAFLLKATLGLGTCCPICFFTVTDHPAAGGGPALTAGLVVSVACLCRVTRGPEGSATFPLGVGRVFLLASLLTQLGLPAMLPPGSPHCSVLCCEPRQLPP